MAIQTDRASNGAFGSAIVTLPESIAEHSNAAAVPYVVRSSHQPSGGRADAQDGEVIAAGVNAADVVHFAADGEVEGLWRPGEHTGKCILMTANLLPNRICDVWPGTRRSGRAKFYLRKLLGILHGQHPEQDRIDH